MAKSYTTNSGELICYTRLGLFLIGEGNVKDFKAVMQRNEISKNKISDMYVEDSCTH